MGITSDELRDLTALINARRAEFDDKTLHVFERLSLGEVRMVYEVIAEWQEARGVDVSELSAAWPPMPDLDGGRDIFAEHPVAGEPDALERALAEDGMGGDDEETHDDYEADLDFGSDDPNAPATPLSRAVMRSTKPPLPHPDTARERLANALANGSGGALVQALARDEDEPDDSCRRTRSGLLLPTMEEVIAEVQRISMDGKTMPSLSQYNAARPATWLNGLDQSNRLGLTWNQLAERAGLKPRGRAKAEE